MSMGRQVLSAFVFFVHFVSNPIFIGTFPSRWSMHSSSMSQWREGWTSEPCWWRGRWTTLSKLEIKFWKFKTRNIICQNPLFIQVKQKKIVVKKIEWLEVSCHLANWKLNQYKTSWKNWILIGHFLRILQKWKWLLESWLHWEWRKFLGREIMVLVEKYLLGPILEFPHWAPPISGPDATWPFWAMLTD